MKKGFLFGIIFALFIFIESAYADSCDVLDMFDGTYVGVGAIDMQKMPDREIYGTLMSFFMTDPEAHKVLVDLEKSGLSSKSVRRIVVGIPADVERAEFLMIWETMSSIKPYVPVLEKYAEAFEKKKLGNHDYYCKKNGNQCLLMLDESLVLASQAKMNNFILMLDKTSKNNKNVKLKEIAHETDQKKDAWLVFWLDDVQRGRIGQGDPLVDMSAEGKGTLRLGSIRSGSVTLDFSKGMHANITIQMLEPAHAQYFSDILTTLLERARNDEDVITLGLVDVMNGIKLGARKNEFVVTVAYSQKTFSQLISVVSDLVKMTARDGLENTTAKKIQS